VPFMVACKDPTLVVTVKVADEGLAVSVAKNCTVIKHVVCVGSVPTQLGLTIKKVGELVSATREIEILFPDPLLTVNP